MRKSRKSVKRTIRNTSRAVSPSTTRCEMKGEPLPKSHGAPLRLIVPGWFGIAWVKWLTRIEVMDRRYMSKYMAREYVTIRGEEHDGTTIWRETSVGPMDVKSVVARVVRRKDGL